MTDFERDLALHMQQSVSFGLNRRAEQIVDSLARRHSGAALSNREARALIAIAWRYRGQVARRYQPAIFLFQTDYLADEASAGGGGLYQQPEPRAATRMNQTGRIRPIPPPLQGREIHEGTPLWSRVLH